ncbi:MAG: NAD-dependent epimerase/dehydratase family protein [Deltaproteobacteria bacterium]|nr:NAD-dependent epimerase/dehydratase family protein [Deltaproteobacteria bacterium]
MYKIYRHKKCGVNILITGAGGFIGNALCRRLASDNKVVGVDITGPVDEAFNIAWEQADLTDEDSVTAICEKHSPDVVIHCAGIAHQKIGAVDSATYMRVNSEVTEGLARAAGESNPDVLFIFLSSVSVYGEQGQETSRKGAKAQKRKNNNGIVEDGECWPSSDYAVSKLDAERRLRALYDEVIIRNLVIVRLAPVYDRDWSLNLDRRVFAPGKVAYLRFGSGSQRMSALARPNLVEFIVHVLQSADECGLDSGFRRNDEQESGNDEKEDRNSKNEGRNDKNEGVNDERGCLRIFNVCDAEAYEFDRIIGVFRRSGIQPDRLVISVPLSFAWVATRLAGLIFRNKKEWIYSCYDKLACDLVFDNGRMMGTGFRAKHSLETTFDPEMVSRKGAKTQR